MPWSALEAVFFLLMGLGTVWLGVYLPHANRSAASDPAAPRDRRWSPAEVWLWRIGCTTIGLGWVCFGLTTLRHSQGRYTKVPANAPLIDHIIWILGLVCLMGGFAVLFAWALVQYALDRRTRRDESGDSRPPEI